MRQRLRRRLATTALALTAATALTGCGPKYTGVATIRDLTHTPGHYTTTTNTTVIPISKDTLMPVTTPQTTWVPDRWTTTACAFLPEEGEHCWRKTVGQDFFNRAAIGDQVQMQDGTIQYLLDPR